MVKHKRLVIEFDVSFISSDPKWQFLLKEYIEVEWLQINVPINYEQNIVFE